MTAIKAYFSKVVATPVRKTSNSVTSISYTSLDEPSLDHQWNKVANIGYSLYKQTVSKQFPERTLDHEYRAS
jgi:hypothetical protein